MTAFGEYLLRKSISRSEVARKTRLAEKRVNELATVSVSNLKVTELLLISKAIELDPRELLEIVCGLQPKQ